jgi:hypothetical protein
VVQGDGEQVVADKALTCGRLCADLPMNGRALPLGAELKSARTRSPICIRSTSASMSARSSEASAWKNGRGPVCQTTDCLTTKPYQAMPVRSATGTTTRQGQPVRSRIGVILGLPGSGWDDHCAAASLRTDPAREQDEQGDGENDKPPYDQEPMSGHLVQPFGGQLA